MEARLTKTERRQISSLIWICPRYHSRSRKYRQGFERWAGFHCQARPTWLHLSVPNRHSSTSSSRPKATRDMLQLAIRDGRTKTLSRPLWTSGTGHGNHFVLGRFMVQSLTFEGTTYHSIGSLVNFRSLAGTPDLRWSLLAS